MYDGILIFGTDKDTFLYISMTIWLLIIIIRSIYQYKKDIKNWVINERIKILSQYMDVERIELEFIQSTVKL